MINLTRKLLQYLIKTCREEGFSDADIKEELNLAIKKFKRLKFDDKDAAKEVAKTAEEEVKKLGE